MPSAEHETPIALVNLEPGVLTWLLRDVARLEIPDSAASRPYPTEAQITAPATYHADAVHVFEDANGRATLAVILEVQRRYDPGKLRTWRLYLAHVEHDVDASAALLVYAPNRAVAQRYRRATAADGLSSLLRPAIIDSSQIPLITDPDSAVAHPAATILGAIAHATEAAIDEAFPALAAVLGSVPSHRRQTYHDIVLAGIEGTANDRWRDYMTTTKLPYLSNTLNESYKSGAEQGRAEGMSEGRAEGMSEGLAEGLADSIVAVAEARGLAAPAEIRDHIGSAADLDQLRTWLTRAATADRLEDVFVD